MVPVVCLCAAMSVSMNGLVMPNAGGVVINEYWADDYGQDDVEFIELYSRDGASLAGVSLIVLDGDTAGDVEGRNYRRVTLRVDFGAEDAIGAEGRLLLGSGTGMSVDREFPIGSLQNNTQTIALVPTADIAYEPGSERLTPESALRLSAVVIDAVAVMDADEGDHVYLDAAVLPSNGSGHAWDWAARSTDGATTWRFQDNYAGRIELGDPTNDSATPGMPNGGEAPQAVDVCSCDVDGDGKTDAADLLGFLACWFPATRGECLD